MAPTSSPPPTRFLLPLLLMAAPTLLSHPPDPNSPPPSAIDGVDLRFNPSMAVLVVVVMTAFFFVAFFSVYIRHCGRGIPDPLSPAANRPRRPVGLDPSAIESLPTFLYSDVMGLKLGNSPLECAVCLSDFVPDDLLRLLPHCSHAFHPACIDAWLSTRSTCPVCRHDLSAPPDLVAVSMPPPPPPPPDRDRAAAASEEEDGEDTRECRVWDRYTLRLPEHVRREMIAGGLHRSVSMMVLPDGDGSTRRGVRRLWGTKSDRWAFLSRPFWEGSTRRGDGSIKKGAGEGGGGEGSTNRGKVLDCIGGGGLPKEEGSNRSGAHQC